MKAGEKKSTNSWYYSNGPYNDVVLFSKATLSRNLANFPFSDRLSDADRDRIISIAIDCFNHFSDAEDYFSTKVDQVDDIKKTFIQEKFYTTDDDLKNKAFIINKKEDVICLINSSDHFKFSVFRPGFDFKSSFDEVYRLDSKLQELVQFAASYDFGYLNSHFTDCGSGLQLSCRLFLPACSIMEKCSFLNDFCRTRNISFKASYGPCSSELISGFSSPGMSLGSFYDISTVTSTEGTEMDQVAEMVSCVKKIIETELQYRAACVETRLMEIKNFFFRSVSLAKSSYFINYKEGMEIIAGAMFARCLNLAGGYEIQDLFSLAVRTQNGFLNVFNNSESVKFENDEELPKSKRIEYMRALIFREFFTDINLEN